MKEEVTTALITALQTLLTGTDVVKIYDVSREPEAKQVVIGAESETFANGPTGRPWAWKVNVTCDCITHSTDDPSGATRNAIISTVFNYFMGLSKGGLTVTGYYLDAVMDIAEGNVKIWGSHFLGAPVTATLIVGIKKGDYHGKCRIIWSFNSYGESNFPKHKSIG